MKNINQIIIFFVAIFLVSACGTIRKGFEADKRTGEEFLVEKKSLLEKCYSVDPVSGLDEAYQKANVEDVKKIKTYKTLKGLKS